MKMEGQLTLDLGLLSAEQEEQVQSFIENKAKENILNIAYTGRKENVLIAAGFRPGIDFTNTFKSEVVTETRQFGYGFNNTEFETEVTFIKNTGDIFIIRNIIRLDDEDKVVVTPNEVWFNLSDDKIECSQLVGSFRAVKPETLLRKLHEFNALQEIKAHNELERRIKSREAINGLKTVYPHATEIKEITEFEGKYNRYETKRIRVSFEDGSFITYNNGWNGLDIDKVFDAKYLEPTKEEIAIRIANQNK
jgi:hypothetical protein